MTSLIDDENSDAQSPRPVALEADLAWLDTIVESGRPESVEHEAEK